MSAEEWPLLDYQNGAWLGGRVRALERLADSSNPTPASSPANGRMMTGSDIVRHRDMYQKLFTTMIGYLNMGLGPEDAVERNPLKEYQAEFGDPSAFTVRRPPEHDDRLRAGLRFSSAVCPFGRGGDTGVFALGSSREPEPRRERVDGVADGSGIMCPQCGSGLPAQAASPFASSSSRNSFLLYDLERRPPRGPAPPKHARPGAPPQIDANTVSAAYSALQREGWVESRRGSGVYVRSRNRRRASHPEQTLDQLIADFFRSSREQGISLRRVHERLRHWLALQPPDRFAVIDPDEELRRILAAEIEAAVGFPAVAMAPEACREAAALAGSIPVVLLSKYDALRATLPADAECVALKVRSVPGSLAAWMPIGPMP